MEVFFVVVLPIVVALGIFAFNPDAANGVTHTSTERNRRRRHLKATRDSRQKCRPGQRADLPWR